MKNLADHRWRKNANASGLSCAPIEALHLVGKRSAADFEPFRKENFKWISFHLPCDWDADRKSRLPIVRNRRKNDSRTPPSLLMASLRIERQPYEIAAIGNVLSPTRLRCQPAHPFQLRDVDFAR